MNGIHDLGGMHGFGPVDPEPDEPVFHHDWERRAFALNLATGFLGRWNIDMGRYAREHMPPAEYLATTYYEHWLYGLERLLVEKGLCGANELATMRPNGRAQGLKAVAVENVPTMLRNRRAARMDDHLAPPRFTAGDRVRTKNLHPTGHTRLPRYARDKSGVVDRDHGVFILPDDGTRYYYFWLAALEKVVADKRLVLADELADRKDAWDRAARATPHGRPIELPRDRL